MPRTKNPKNNPKKALEIPSNHQFKLSTLRVLTLYRHLPIKSSHFFGTKPLLLIYQHHAIRFGRALLQTELVGRCGGLQHRAQLRVDSHGQATEEVELLRRCVSLRKPLRSVFIKELLDGHSSISGYPLEKPEANVCQSKTRLVNLANSTRSLLVPLGIFAVSTAPDHDAGLTAELAKLRCLHTVVPITIHTVQRLAGHIHRGSEGFKTLLPAAYLQLSTMNEATGKHLLISPGMIVRIPIAGARAVLYPKTTHEEKGITLLVQMHIVEGQGCKVTNCTNLNHGGFYQAGRLLQLDFQLTEYHQGCGQNGTSSCHLETHTGCVCSVSIGPGPTGSPFSPDSGTVVSSMTGTLTPASCQGPITRTC